MRVALPFVAVVAVALAAVVQVASASADTMLACAPGYSPCLPVRGDLDCDDIPDAKKPAA